MVEIKFIVVVMEFQKLKFIRRNSSAGPENFWEIRYMCKDWTVILSTDAIGFQDIFRS